MDETYRAYVQQQFGQRHSQYTFEALERGRKMNEQQYYVFTSGFGNFISGSSALAMRTYTYTREVSAALRFTSVYDAIKWSNGVAYDNGRRNQRHNSSLRLCRLRPIPQPCFELGDEVV